MPFQKGRSGNPAGRPRKHPRKDQVVVFTHDKPVVMDAAPTVRSRDGELAQQPPRLRFIS